MHVPFFTAARLCAATFAALTLCLMFMPGMIYALFELQASDAADVLAKRASVLFAGLAYLTFTCAGHSANPSRRCVAVSIGLVLISLAGLGAVEWARGAVGLGIWVAIAVECALAALLWTAEFRGPGSLSRKSAVK